MSGQPPAHQRSGTNRKSDIVKKKQTDQRGFFYLRIAASAGLCLAALSFVFAALGASGSSGPGTRTGNETKIAPWVLKQIAARQQVGEDLQSNGHAGRKTGQKIEALVILADQADLTEAKNLQSRAQKRRRVRDLLWDKARQTQTPLLQWLKARQVEHRPFYIVNAIWVKTDAATIAAIAQRPDVLRIEGNPQIRNVAEPFGNSEAAPEATAGPEPGITYTGAPEVWNLGYTGQGIVIAGADTGYRWNHAALKNQYRGWDGVAADHDYNWHDSIHTGGGSCGHDSLEPCDDHGHGTHTMGTAVGDDGGDNQIGMAPGARWIGCRNMDGGVGTPARYIECMEFFLAPYPVGGTPAEGDPSKAPDITTNSWGCPESEGCSVDSLQAAVEAQRAAGIFMVVAAGNDGPTCESIGDPPSFYDAVYSIGALNTGTDTIAGFSSRGPVYIDGSLRLKPDLTAPGTNVRSSLKDTKTSYGKLSGTSMATPHVAGAVALLWSAQPELRNDVERTEAFLNQSAAPILSNGCTGDVATWPNNVYGYGRLDIKEAVDRALLRITGVTEDESGIVIGFYAVAGRSYRLERKLDMEGSAWESLPGTPDFTATSTGPGQMVDVAPGGGFAFYHVRILP